MARPGGALAVRHRAERDDLRRPRDHRRLEHLGVLARGHVRAALVARADLRPAWPPTGSTSTWATSSPDELLADPLYQKITAADDATDLLHDFGLSVDKPESAENTDRPYQWSFALDLGRTRLVMLDNRCNRVLTPGRREMLPAAGVGLVRRPGPRRLRPPGGRLVPAVADAAGDPPPGGLERAERRLGQAARGGRSPSGSAAPSTWSTGPRSPARSTRSTELFRRLGEGGEGAPGHRVGAGGAYAAPASISVLSGDVHHSYVARADLGPAVRTPVHQLTCSPIHNQVPAFMRPLMRFGWSRAGRAGDARPGPVGRGAEAGADLAPAGRPVLRQRGQHAAARRAAEAEMTIEGTNSDGELFEVATVRLQSRVNGLHRPRRRSRMAR